MKWFEGSIGDAVSAAKASKGVFVVYVYDDSELSKKASESLDTPEVSDVLSSSKFVAIRLKNKSEGANQFSQIYPLIVIPSLFFISGETGIPLEVIGGEFVAESFITKVNKLLDNKNEPSEIQETSQNQDELTPPEQNIPPVVNELSEQDEVRETAVAGGIHDVTIGAQESLPSDVPAEVTPAEETVDKNDDLETRVERAKELIAIKQVEKAKDESEKVKEKEKERRFVGQEMTKMKRKRDEDEVASYVRERQKEKEEERKARERIRAQIAADREEKQMRAALFHGEEPQRSPSSTPGTQDSVPQPQPASVQSDRTRLKFRLPDGSSSTGHFSSTAKLSEVRTYVHGNVSLPFSQFSLVSSLQQRPFTNSQMDATLEELGLVPSAILLVIPVVSSSASLVPAASSFANYFWLLISPLTFIFGFIKQFVGLGVGHGGPSRRDGMSQSRSNSGGATSDVSGATTSSQSGPSSNAYDKGSGVRFRREGNVHRLQNSPDDEDENNTWNGNSTQQM